LVRQLIEWLYREKPLLPGELENCPRLRLLMLPTMLPQVFPSSPLLNHTFHFGGKANTKTGLMARLEIVIRFATNSGFAQAPNYVGSDAPLIKSAHLL